MSDTSELDKKIDALVVKNVSRRENELKQLKAHGVGVKPGINFVEWNRGDKILLTADELEQLVALEGGGAENRQSISVDLFERIQASLRQSIAASISLKLDDSRRFFIAF